MDNIDYIKINKSLKTPLYIQIANNIKDLISRDIYIAEDKLPPIRILSEILGVNNVTVVSAYKMLSDDGITYKVRGSGSYIAPKHEELSAQVKELETVENQSEYLRSAQMEINDHLINFATATPKANLFPVAEFKTSINYVLDRDMGEAFGYQEAKGYFPLRESICSYLSNTGINVSTENIQIISGAQQGLDIVAKSVLNYGDVVIVEAPTYSGAIASFRLRGVKIIQIPMQVDGVDIKKLEDIVRRYSPKMMYTMINCQNPTGYSYSDKKKEKLLKIAEEYGMYILEDDYVGELIYSKQKTVPLKVIDENEIVIYIKSFSKILMPGLRLGFMVVPDKLNHDIQKAKQATDISTSGLIQRTFDVYLREGHWEKQLDYMKNIYRKRYDKMIESLNKYMPRRVNFYVPRGGILFWIELPKNYDSRKFCNEIKNSKVALVPGDLFYYSDEISNGIRLSIASVTEDEIENGVKYLSEYLTIFMDNGKTVMNNEMLPIL